MNHSNVTSKGSADANPPTRPCSLWRRLLIMAYDAVAVLVLLMVTTVLFMLAGFEKLNVVRDLPYAAALLLTWFLYLGWCWRRGGMTLGMRAWGVRIERIDGSPPGWRDCLIRFLSAFLSAAALGLGFIWSLFDRQRRCWHDLLSGTRLLRG